MKRKIILVFVIIIIVVGALLIMSNKETNNFSKINIEDISSIELARTNECIKNKDSIKEIYNMLSEIKMEEVDMSEVNQDGIDGGYDTFLINVNDKKIRVSSWINKYMTIDGKAYITDKYVSETFLNEYLEKE